MVGKLALALTGGRRSAVHKAVGSVGKAGVVPTFALVRRLTLGTILGTIEGCLKSCRQV